MMNRELSERRLTENELIFRELNQRVIEDLTSLKDLAKSHNQSSLAPDSTHPLHFYCECSNVGCSNRIILSPDEYEKIHRNTRRFAIAKGHQTPEIESVVKNTAEYDIVEKYREPSQVISG